MGKLEVRIVQLEPLRVATALGFGEQPETIAWEKILKWAREQGIDLQKARYFGFNNPNPSPGSPNYGYEQWIVAAPGMEGSDEVEIKEFPGGLYAVARCEGIQNIGDVWKALVAWRDESPYKKAQHQWLEECLTPPIGEMALEDYVFDLYAPIAE